MHPSILKTHVRRCLLSCVVVFLIGLLSPGAVYCQTEEVLPVPIDRLAPGYYIDGRVFQDLGLSADQLLEGRKLMRLHLNWFETDYIEMVGRRGSTEWRPNAYIEWHSRLTSILDEKQIEMLNQFITAKYYSIETKRMLVATLPTDLDGLLGEVAWLHPDISDAIGVSLKQRTSSTTALRNFDGLKHKQMEKFENKSNAFFSQWQSDLMAEMNHVQKEKFRQAMGDNFDFKKEILSFAKLAYSQGPLFLLEKHNVRFNCNETQPGKMMFLANLKSAINGSYEWTGLFYMLSTSEIENELRLNKNQIDDIQDLEAEWLAEHPIPNIFHSSNSFGLGKERNQRHTENGQVEAEADEQKYMLKELNEIFNLKQQKRLTQIWNQLVLRFGWNEVQLTHPDWQRELGFSDQLTRSFASINSEQRNQFREFVQANVKYQQQLKTNLRKDLAAILNDDQRTRLKRLFGIYF